MKGFKTVILGVATIALAVLSDDAAKQLIMDNFAVAGSGLGLAIIVLRAVTTSPIFKKEPKP